MKKTLIASAVALTSLFSSNSNANIIVTNMRFIADGFVETLATTGSLDELGGGGFVALDPFLFNTWTATQQTLFLDNTATWSGATGDSSSGNDAFDYDDEIAALAGGQIAIGMFFDWNNTTTAVLAIFECSDFGGTVEDPILDCYGINPVTLDNGPFIGSAIMLNAVPVPAAVWLMGTGLLGLMGVARRRQLR